MLNTYYSLFSNIKTKLINIKDKIFVTTMFASGKEVLPNVFVLSHICFCDKTRWGIHTNWPKPSYKTFSFHTLNGYWRYKSEVYLWIILTILTNDFDKLDTFIRWRTRSDYCLTNGLWRAMISYFPVVLLIILRNQSRTRNRTSHANPTDLLEAGTCFNHSWLL